MEQKPFTKEEQKVVELITDAHNLFMKLPRNHPDEAREWVDGIHRLQSILMHRVLVRDYPHVFVGNLLKAEK